MVSADEVDDLDCMPRIKRRRKLLLRRPSSWPPAPLRRPAAKRVSLGVQKKLPGLPRGMKFDPSDEDLLWHLLAEVGKGEAEPHPFISEFIISLDENDGFGYFHPHKLPGIKQDGSVSYFFHRTFKPYDAKSRECRKILSDDFGIARWHKIGKTKPVYMDGIHKGCKKIMVLYMSMAEGQKPEKTNWVMHQYHVGTGEDEEGGFVVSRVFYQLKSRQGDRNAQDLSLDIVEAVGTEVEPVVAPRSIEPESHAENPHSSLISSEASTQATYHDTRAEENDAHAGWRKPDNNDNLPIEDPKQGKIQPQFLLDSQQHGDNILTCDELLQRQSSCGAVVEMSKSSISDNAELGGNDLEKETNASSRPSVNLMNNINECIAGRVKDEIQPADAQFPLEECYVDSAEHDAANSMANPLIESPDSVISWSLLTVDQSSRSPNCLNNESLKASHCQVNQERVNILSYQAAAPEVKLPVVGGEHGHLNAKSQPHSSAFSAILVPLMAEPLEENYVSNVSETNVAMQYSTDISPDKGTAACSSTSAPSLSDAIVNPDYSSSRSSKPKQTQEWSHRCSDEACISEAKLCSLVRRPAHQNDNDHMSNSVPSVSPIEVKAEPWEESNTKCIPEENAVKLSSPSLSGHPTESSCTDTLCLSKANPQDNLLSEGRNSKENISTSYITSSQTSLPKDVHHNSSAAKLLSTTTSGSLDTIISKSSWVFNQCSANYGNFQDNILSNRSNLQEKIDSICFDQASLHEIKFEAIDRLPNSVSSSCPVRPKLEFMECGLFSPCQSPSILPELDMLRTTVKRECSDELAADVIDHIPLRERMEMTASGSVTNLSCDNKMECSLQTAPPPPECGSFDSVNAKARHFSLKRKRKKTATDSVETALEEDAPGLLQVLLDRGITVEEIKLYGDVEDDAALPICCTEDSFEELETVITKLFSEGPSLFKFPSVRQMKGSKAVYCLACLISLIEQTRYLRFRQSPVEWGWCRDLQSFIFVFERHNRIVLERPEYGYATYFFELVGSLPIDWQIKRLVAAMKLPCCSRTILLENKPLSVGEDLTEGEARVLEEYGWMRNSGLGTMLNYCDRVVHDKKFERYSSEWRAKIGELLMRGHDSGRTVLSSLPKKVEQYIGYQNPEIKLEL